MADITTDKNGRPLRERRIRNYGTKPFMGADGKPHKRLPILQARQVAFDELRVERQRSRKRPGSLKK